jgi:hypothetical protein
VGGFGETEVFVEGQHAGTTLSQSFEVHRLEFEDPFAFGGAGGEFAAGEEGLPAAVEFEEDAAGAFFGGGKSGGDLVGLESGSQAGARGDAFGENVDPDAVAFEAAGEIGAGDVLAGNAEEAGAFGGIEGADFGFEGGVDAEEA